MKKTVISFIISAIIGLGLGYVIYDILPDFSNKSSGEAETEIKKTEPVKVAQKEKDSPDENTTSAGETNILQSKGCLGCHSVEGLNLKGGATGPDLTQAFKNVEGKHGKPVKEFLKEPTSAVMSGVISGNPLKDEEISKIETVLKKASEAKK